MKHSQELFARAQRSLAGGVSSSTRVNRALGHPLYFDRAQGCRLIDLDGRDYLDLCCSHGAALLGHADPRVKHAIGKALSRGAPCSYENEQLAELAELLCDTIPCCQRVRLTGSGSEATLHTIRLARAFTGRAKLLKFEGHFHGYHDQVMFSAGAPADRLGPLDEPAKHPASAGITRDIEGQLVVAAYNDPGRLEAAFALHAADLAAVILEPVYYNAGCILPTPEFLKTLVRLTQRHGVLLIFDEVLSAFRMAPGGAQQYLGVTPDLCTIGKAVGGGVPLSVFGGRREVMDRLMPLGDCQHSGTYNGHAVAVSAALVAVTAYRQDGFYEHINAVGEKLFAGLSASFQRHGVPGRVLGLGARFGVYFGLSGEIRSYRDAVRHDRAAMLRFVRLAIEEGVYLHDYGGAACHHGFCSAMTLADADEALVRLDRAVARMTQPE